MSANNSMYGGAAGGHHESDGTVLQALGGAVEWPAEGERRDEASSGPRTRRNTPRRWGGRIVAALLALILLVVLSAAGGLYYLDKQFTGRVYPNISVRGLAIGQMTENEARAALQQQYAAFLKQPITLVYLDKTWHPSLGDLGAQLDIDGAVQTALASGRKNGLVDNLWEVAAIWQRGIELPLHLTVNQEAMQHYLSAHAPEIEIPGNDAQLLIQGTAIGTAPAHVGRQLLYDETQQELTAALQTLEPQQVSLRTRELTPLLRDEAVIEAQQKAQSFLQAPLTLKAQDKSYTWTPEDLVSMLRVQRVPGDAATTGDSLQVSIDGTVIGQRLHAIADATERKGDYPHVAWNGGNLKITRPGTSGTRMDEQKALQMVMAASGAANRIVDLPFQTVQAPVTESNLAQLGIKELVSVGQSDFTGSAAYRIHNIQVGMKLMDGILLAPGDEFSFNNNVGEIDESNGFVQGYAIVANRTQLEWGGGICQDSTTMFRAAFFAGLPITERANHRFYISWYDKYGFGADGNGPGLDATIYTGAQDLKFVNDTGNWLLIQTTTDLSRALAEVRIYGTKPNRTVEVTHAITAKVPAPTQPKMLVDTTLPPGTRKQTDTARGGMTIDVYRTITENGVQRKRELFRTIFSAWPNIYLYNPAPKPQPPVATPAPDGSQPPADGSQPPATGTQPPATGTQPPVQPPAPPVVAPVVPPTNG